MLVKYFQHLHANFIKGISYGQYVGCIEIFKSKICFARKEDMSSHFYLTLGNTYINFTEPPSGVSVISGDPNTSISCIMML